MQSSDVIIALILIVLIFYAIKKIYSLIKGTVAEIKEFMRVQKMPTSERVRQNERRKIELEKLKIDGKLSSSQGLLILILLSLSMCFIFIEDKTDSSNNTNNYSQETKQALWVEKGKEAVKERLKDPQSAQFKNVFYSNSGGAHATCGQINSKSPSGGYTGYQYFISAGDVSLTFFEKEVKDFPQVWNKFCIK